MSASPSHKADTRPHLLSVGSQQMLWLAVSLVLSRCLFFTITHLSNLINTGSAMLRWYTDINSKKSVQKNVK